MKICDTFCTHVLLEPNFQRISLKKKFFFTIFVVSSSANETLTTVTSSHLCEEIDDTQEKISFLFRFAETCKNGTIRLEFGSAPNEIREFFCCSNFEIIFIIFERAIINYESVSSLRKL